MNRIAAVLNKELLLLLRNKTSLFLILGYPFLFALFFGSILGAQFSDKSYPIGLIDQENSATSRSIITSLEQRKIFDTKKFSSVEEAKAMLHEDKLAAYMVFKPGFTATLTPPLSFEIGYDPAKEEVLPLCLGAVAMGSLQELRTPLLFQTVEGALKPRSAYDLSYPASMVWAMMSCVIAFAMSIVHEYSEGTMVRLKMSLLSLWEILIAKALACFLVCLLMTAFLTAFAWMAMNLTIQHPLGFILSSIASAFCFSCLMILLGTFSRKPDVVGGLSRATMMAMMMLGGGMIPVYFMPGWMHPISQLSPVRWSIVALEGSLWRGFSFAEQSFSVAVLIAFSLLFLTLGFFQLKRQQQV